MRLFVIILLFFVSALSEAQIYLDVKGTFRPSNYASFLSVPRNHHFIVSKDGKAASKALIVTELSDLEIQRRLEVLGAVPGNNLTMETWTERQNSQSTAPDQKVKGTPIRIEIILKNGTVVKPEDILTDKFGKGFDFHFGGHESLRSEWQSGCVVCLQSCPGGRISNAAYTIRDFVKDVSAFPVKKPGSISEGEAVIVRFYVE